MVIEQVQTIDDSCESSSLNAAILTFKLFKSENENETCGSSMFNSGSEADDSEKASAEPTEDKNNTIFSSWSLKR